MMVALIAVAAMFPPPPFSRLVEVPVVLESEFGKEQSVELPSLGPGMDWDEAILSWNVDGAERSRLLVDVQIKRGDSTSRWLRVADWTGDLSLGPRASIPDQKADDASMLTDVLRKKPGNDELIVRLTLTQLKPGPNAKVKFFSACFSNSGSIPSPNPPSGVKCEIEGMPEIAQGPYEHGKLAYPANRVSKNFKDWFDSVNGAQYCSPTSASMVLRYWSMALIREDLNVDVPATVAGVFDEKYPGTGNWSFNAAYMGSFPGMRAYVTRLDQVDSLETLVAAGIPVICSVAHNLLLANGKPAGGDGHLVVLVGFQSDGSPIIHDPGRSTGVRQVYRRNDFVSAWTASRRTVYLCYPEGRKLPNIAGLPSKSVIGN